MTTLENGSSKPGIIGWMARHAVAPNLLMIVLIGGGIISGLQIKQEVFPEFDLDQVMVTVPYPGASPSEIEHAVVLAIEEGVQGLDGVKEVTSAAREGVGVVNIELLRGADAQKLSQEIKNEVDRIQSFPEEIERPEVYLLTRRRQVVSLAVYGDEDERALHELAESIRDRLLQDEKITQIELGGVKPLEISIEVPQANLRAYDLTLSQIAQRVREASLEMPGGGLKTEGGEILVRVKERRDYGTEFTDLPIVTRNDGTELRLGQMAHIIDGFEDVDRFATYNGKPAVMINVYRVGDQTPIEVSEAVRKHMADLEEELPSGIGLAINNDMSEIYYQRINLLLRNAALGLTLVLVLLGVFLEARLAFWVTMGIPISFLGALLLLPTLGVSLNMVSLFAFIIALGIVVDDAIVVGENVYLWHQRREPFITAAIGGAREVVQPVVFSVLTNVVAFVPMFFVPGFMGKVFRMIPCVVILAFVISLVESLLILPAHLGHQHDIRSGTLRGRIHGVQRAFSDWLARMIQNVYGPLLDKALSYRYLTVSVGVGILILTVGYVASGRTGIALFPRMESDMALCSVALPYGTSVEVTKQVRDELVGQAEEIIREVENKSGKKLIEGVYAEIGATSGPGRAGGTGGVSGGHMASVMVYLTPPEERPMGTTEFVNLWRKQVGVIAGVESLVFRADAGGPGGGAAMTVELSHRDLDVLEAASAELADWIRAFPNAKDVDDGFTPGKEQFDFHIKPEGQALGLTAFDIARQVRSAYYGAEVVRQQRSRNELKIMVRLPEAERTSEYDLEELVLRTPAGREIPLREAVHASRGRAYTTIDRRQGRRIVTVTADVDPPDQANLILSELKAEALPELIQKYPGLSYSFEGEQADMRDSIQSLLIGLAIAMLVVFAMLAIPLRSYIQPAIIMASIPFGIIGATLGHMIMGYSLSIISLMGIVALSGVVVNDSLILIDFANRGHRGGQSAHDAVLEAGVRRFRPILLTSLTTFGGLAPMIFETSRQARFLIPMALSLGYGIIFATAITLLLVPCLFLVLEDIRGLFATRHDSDAETATASPVTALVDSGSPKDK